jgi:hypothetical protein
MVIVNSMSKNPTLLVKRVKYFALVARKCKVESMHFQRAERALFALLPAMLARQVRKLPLEEQIRTLFQMSYISRALPKPPKEVADQAMAEQLNMLCHSPIAIPEWLYVKLHATGCHLRPNWDEKEMDPGGGGTSACLEYSRKDGGKWAGLFHELDNSGIKISIQDSLSMGPSVHLGEPQPLTEAGQYWRGLLKGALQQWVEDYSTIDIPADHFDHEQVAVLEYGYKTRMVSKSPFKLVAVSEGFRKVLFYETLFSLRPCRAALQDMVLKLSGVDPLHPHDRGRFIFSSDLSKATDTLSHEALFAVCAGLGLPSYLVYGGRIAGHKMTRGTLMGIPCSWPILNIIHWRIGRMVDHGEDFMIKGDDLIAFWTLAQIAKYKTLCHMVGFIVKEEASFIGRDFGIFCETLFTITDGTLHPVEKDYIPLRFCHCESDTVARGVHVPLPAILTLGDTIRSFRGRVPHETLVRVQGYVARGWPTSGRKMGVDPYLPKEFGGLGLVPHHEERLLSRRDRVVVTYYHNHPDEFVKDSLRLSYSSRSKVMDDTVRYMSDRFIGRVKFRLKTETNESQLGEILPYVMQRLFESVYGTLGFQAEPEDLIFRRRGPAALLRDMGKLAKRIRRQVGNAPPLRWTYASAYALKGRVYPDFRTSLVFKYTGLVASSMTEEELDTWLMRIKRDGHPLEMRPVPFWTDPTPDPVWTVQDQLTLRASIRLMLNEPTPRAPPEEEPFKNAFLKGPVGNAARRRARRPSF